MVPWGRGEGTDREFGKVMYTLLYSKWVNIKDLLYSTWNFTNAMWQPGGKRGLGENGYRHIYG